MEILAQGIATAVAPYLHLGYLAAYSDPIPSWSQLVAAPLVVGTCMAPVALWMYMRAREQGNKPRGLAIPALIFLACLVVALVRLSGPGPPPQEVTVARARSILELVGIASRSTETDQLLTSLRDRRVHLPTYHGRRGGLAPSAPDPMGDQVHTDYWGNEFELKSRIVTMEWTDSGHKTWKEDVREYWLVSAGPDGQFGTADDIVIDPATK